MNNDHLLTVHINKIKIIFTTSTIRIVARLNDRYEVHL